MDGKKEDNIILHVIENGNLDHAMDLIQQMDDSEDVLKDFFEGIICYKLQKWGDALNHFYKIEEKDPNHSEAKNYISLISGILEFYHKDIYNP